jgi:glutamyl-tRNA reductase
MHLTILFRSKIMLFCVAGLSFRKATVEIREMLSFSEIDLADAYKLLLAKDEIEECVILSTCNRVEIYSILSTDRPNILKDFIRDYHKYSESIDNVFYTKWGADALVHLCKVAAGLDSMVIGESQIFGQVKDAYTKALMNGGINHALSHLFSQVNSIVKKVRTKTGIGEKSLSVSYAAVKLAQTIFKDIKDKKVMILGAGETGELTLRNLITAGISDIVVANRTFKKAVEVAEKFKGIPIMLHELDEYLPSVDILISSINGSEILISAEKINKIKGVRVNQSILIVDISVPRSIESSVSGIQNVYLYNIDDLEAVVESNSLARHREKEKCIALIENKIPVLLKFIESCDIIPTFVSIRSKAEEIRKNGIEQALSLQSINYKQKDTIDSLTKAMVNKILNQSELLVKEFARNSLHGEKYKLRP